MIKTGPLEKPLAFLSDVHGNLPALEAVLADLSRLDVAHVFVAGDLVFGGAQPLEVYQRLMQVGAKCVRGLSDTALVTLNPETMKPSSPKEDEQLARFLDTRKALGEVALQYIRSLPTQLRLPLVDGSEVLMVHGSPRDATEEMSFEMSDDELLSRVDDDPADVIVCGSSHVPFLRAIDTLSIVNVGSVGEAPEGGHAHYTVLTPSATGARIDQHTVAYGA